MAKVLMLCHAAGDERGGSAGGMAGDQTGGEVCVRPWYAGNWDSIIRPKSTALAQRMATMAEYLANSNLVGYDQSQRNTLYNELEKINWNYKNLTVKCETDCSAFVSTCAKGSGSNVQRVYGNCAYTGNMAELFLKTGDYIILQNSKYLTSPNYLQQGDILLRTSGHTALVLGWREGSYNQPDPGVNNGSCTIAQIKEMQSFYGVVADGAWGPKSKAAAGGLDANAAWIKYQASKNPYPEPTRELKYGSIGEDVKWVQYILYKNKYSIGSEKSFVDGEFGTITKTMVLVFQAKHGLKVDGEVGPKTIAELKKL